MGLSIRFKKLVGKFKGKGSRITKKEIVGKLKLVISMKITNKGLQFLDLIQEEISD